MTSNGKWFCKKGCVPASDKIEPQKFSLRKNQGLSHQQTKEEQKTEEPESPAPGSPDDGFDENALQLIYGYQEKVRQKIIQS